MDDNIKLLATPTGKGKSLAKKLKKEMSRDSNRPYMSPGLEQGHAPYNMVVDEPLATGSHFERSGFGDRSRPVGEYRRSRRVVGRGAPEADSVELTDLRRPIKDSGTHKSEQLVQVKGTQYGSVQSDARPRERDPTVSRSAVPGSIQIVEQRQRTRPTTGDSSRCVRWTDMASIPKSVSRDRCTTGLASPTTTAASTSDSLAIDETAILNQDGNSRDNPWTIYHGRDTYFVYGTSLRASNPPSERPHCCEWWDEMWAPYGGFRKITSAWIFASLALLFLANIFFLAAFVTNYWGVVYVVRDPGTARPTGGASGGRMLPSTNGSDALNRTSYMDWIWNTWSRIPNAFRAATGTEDRYDRGVRSGRDTSPKMTSLKDKHVVNRMRGRGAEYWIFGLWQCCRNTDGLCLGPRFEAFYMATRTLCVLSLFLMILSFAWMMGHTLEKLLDYDICTMSCLISMCYLTSIFTTIALICFGIRWPRDFGHEFDGSDPELAYSFYLAAISVPLTFGAAVCSTLDLKTGLEQIRENEKFYSNPDNFTDQTMSSIPRDNISRPRGQKKKRTTYVV